MPPVMSQPSTPSGFIRNLTNPGNITSIYNNSTGNNGTRFQYRLVDAAGEPYRTGTPFLGTTRAPGTSLALAWAGADLGKLPQGARLFIQVRALADSDVPRAWGDWSTGREITTNTAPDIPTNLQPSTGYASSSRPLLTCQATDPDTWEDPAGSLTVYAEILNDDGVTVKYTRTMTWNAAAGQYQYQINSTDEPTYRTFRWRAYAKDAGDLYSGGGETAGSATRSAAQEIVYAAAPTVTITNPASPVSTMSPTVTWTTTDQASVRIELALPDGRVAHRAVVSDSGMRTFTLGSLGWVIPNGWRNGETAVLTVQVTNTSGVTGSAQRSLKLEYTAPSPVTGFSAQPVSLAGTVGPNGVQVTWAKSTLPTGEFHDYLIERQELDGNGVSVVPGTLIYLQSITDINELTFQDFTAESRKYYRYGIVQRRKVGADILWSNRVTLDTRIVWDGIVLHLLFAPQYNEQMAYSCEIRYGDGSWEPSNTYGKVIQTYRTLGRTRRVARIAKSSEIVKSGSFALIDDVQVNQPASRIRDRFLTIWDAQDDGPDGRPHAICWRDGQGGKGSVVYGVFTSPPELTKDGKFHNVWRLNIEMEEVDVTLGVTP